LLQAPGKQEIQQQGGVLFVEIQLSQLISSYGFAFNI
jgi:hypothetical protein